LVAEEKLLCEACGTSSDIAGWRLAADYQGRPAKFPSPFAGLFSHAP
jgi:hypothetical protein